MGDEPRRKRRSMITALIVLLVIYPLSIGPVSALVSAAGQPWLTLIATAVYAPVVLLANFTGTDAILQDYLDFWLELLVPA